MPKKSKLLDIYHVLFTFVIDQILHLHRFDDNARFREVSSILRQRIAPQAVQRLAENYDEMLVRTKPPTRLRPNVHKTLIDRVKITVILQN